MSEKVPEEILKMIMQRGRTWFSSSIQIFSLQIKQSLVEISFTL